MTCEIIHGLYFGFQRCPQIASLSIRGTGFWILQQNNILRGMCSKKRHLCWFPFMSGRGELNWMWRWRQYVLLITVNVCDLIYGWFLPFMYNAKPAVANTSSWTFLSLAFPHRSKLLHFDTLSRYSQVQPSMTDPNWGDTILTPAGLAD